MTVTLRDRLVAYLVGAVLFAVLDLVWLTVVATDLYDRQLGPLLAEQPRAAAAVGFYVLFVAGVVHFVVVPALQRSSVAGAIASGAFFGLVTYATWDLTSLAVIEGFPATLVPIDLAWGAVAASTVSGGTTWLMLRWRRQEPPRQRPEL